MNPPCRAGHAGPVPRGPPGERRRPIVPADPAGAASREAAPEPVSARPARVSEYKHTEFNELGPVPAARALSAPPAAREREKPRPAGSPERPAPP